MGTEVIPMKLLEKLMSRRFAQPAVQLAKWFCYLVIFFYVFCLQKYKFSEKYDQK